MSYEDKIQKKIDARIKIKDERDSIRDLSIRISWAINNATNVVVGAYSELKLKINKYI